MNCCSRISFGLTVILHMKAAHSRIDRKAPSLITLGAFLMRRQEDKIQGTKKASEPVSLNISPKKRPWA